ncbi:MAG: hypothetical protein EOS25_06435 [Mesorhizobium sp.]|uniref:hypothetical protein n=1 Tax=Mesorhizobium sp. TaxID=1871066 RepID=UPI000FE4E2F9|nr:hypothetical protein [Mesorhizobium sp.]RWD50565.1 MAG: hypothetical protein EOS59_09210 [Mesorhizobium sp.]RWE55779.1 MAG: hypothetical protein EOS24_23195 [Mesorhizobium sp.]RWF09684.1 MAG: hypothetical protein EOS69_17190 [Mesorhizobium sp.]RWF20925.1 MAG: hypothetical protein EOS25_06435 [Mesorhizobium sp.]
MKHASERELWVAVILQATQDGLHDKQARDWFLPSRDFIQVCNLAGLDPEAVAERAADAFRRYDQAEADGVKFEIAVRAPGRRRGVATRPAVQYEHDGKSLPLSEWSRLTGIKAETIRTRMSFGRSFAEAIDPNYKRKPKTSTPGVVANLARGQGTGGGSVAQDRAEIEFSANPEKVLP